ncbi:hypothetical protein [Brevibacterium sp. XM4083]|nr:hypothetical protein [Brevibacterium sp. XM4083]MCM1011883.1 hypothetical protein [Brevibacterium sp. XM4083]
MTPLHILILLAVLVVAVLIIAFAVRLGMRWARKDAAQDTSRPPRDSR